MNKLIRFFAVLTMIAGAAWLSAQSNQTVYRVGSVDELIAKIGPDRKLILTAATYSLENLPEETGNPYVRGCPWGKIDYLQIEGVRNLSIESAGPGRALISTPHHEARVMTFYNCQGIRLKGLNLSHATDWGYCEAEVLWLSYCSDIGITDTGLNGSGNRGLVAERCFGLTMERSTIQDCTRGIMRVSDSGNFSFKECLITGNTIFKDDGIILKNSRGITLENCQLRNNPFEPDNNKLVTLSNSTLTMIATEVDGVSMTRVVTDPAKVPEQTEIYAATVAELVNGIGPNRRIILSEEDYFISDLPRGKGQYCDVAGSGPNWGLIIHDVQNLSITHPGDTRARIHTPTADFLEVLSLNNCSGIRIENLNLGHDSDEGGCTAGVIKLDNSSYIELTDTRLYGCGAEGISGYNVMFLTLNRSEISECSTGIMSFNSCVGLEFKDSVFSNNNISFSSDWGGGVKCYWVSGISFNGCVFRDNTLPPEAPLFRLENGSYGSLANTTVDGAAREGQIPPYAVILREQALAYLKKVDYRDYD